MDYYQKNIEYFMQQHYQAVQKKCLDTDSLFEDDTFPPNDDSMFVRPVESFAIIDWKRPRQFIENPRLIVDGSSSLDVHKGSYGCPSFVAACSILASNQDFWNRVVPDANAQDRMMSLYSDEQYTGVFRFRFWRFGTWNEVIIDDKLPTMHDKLYGVRSGDPNEFWCALLEKAYAKVLGCYEAIHYLDAGSILQDMTGGVLQEIPLGLTQVNVETNKNYLFKIMSDTKHSGRSIVTCWIKTTEPGESGSETATGLIVGHVYAVLAVKEIKLGTSFLRHFKIKSDKIRLVKLRNPTGSKEWTGPWSDNSLEWNQISESEKRRMGLTFDGDGEFWMAFDDFCTKFTNASLCRIMQTNHILESWKEAWCHGRWMYNSDPNFNTAGGCLERNLETFLENPQYRFDIQSEAKGNVIMQLQQKESTVHNSADPVPMSNIGIHLLKVESNRLFKIHKYFEDELVQVTPHTTYRTVFLQMTLSKGRYAILPTTYEPEVHTEFLLRIYTETQISFNALMYDYPPKSCWAFCIGYPQMVTRVKVVRGNNCKKLEGGVGSVYVLIGCEGQFVRSKTFKNTKDPNFETAAIFYRKKTKSPITFTVYHYGIICDKFVGQGTIEGTVDSTAAHIEVPLFGRGNLAEKRFPGTLFVDITSSEDIHAL